MVEIEDHEVADSHTRAQYVANQARKGYRLIAGSRVAIKKRHVSNGSHYSREEGDEKTEAKEKEKLLHRKYISFPSMVSFKAVLGEYKTGDLYYGDLDFDIEEDLKALSAEGEPAPKITMPGDKDDKILQAIRASQQTAEHEAELKAAIEESLESQKDHDDNSNANVKAVREFEAARRLEEATGQVTAGESARARVGQAEGNPMPHWMKTLEASVNPPTDTKADSPSPKPSPNTATESQEDMSEKIPLLQHKRKINNVTINEAEILREIRAMRPTNPELFPKGRRPDRNHQKVFREHLLEKRGWRISMIRMKSIVKKHFGPEGDSTYSVLSFGLIPMAIQSDEEGHEKPEKASNPEKQGKRRQKFWKKEKTAQSDEILVKLESSRQERHQSSLTIQVTFNELDESRPYSQPAKKLSLKFNEKTIANTVDNRGNTATILARDVTDARFEPLLKKLFPHTTADYFKQLRESLINDHRLTLTSVPFNGKHFTHGLYNTGEAYGTTGKEHKSLKESMRTPQTVFVLSRAKCMKNEIIALCRDLKMLERENPHDKFFMGGDSARVTVANVKQREDRPNIIATREFSFESWPSYAFTHGMSAIGQEEFAKTLELPRYAQAYFAPIPDTDDRAFYMIIEDLEVETEQNPSLQVGDTFTVHFHEHIPFKNDSDWYGVVTSPIAASKFNTITTRINRRWDKKEGEFDKVPFGRSLLSLKRLNCSPEETLAFVKKLQRIKVTLFPKHSGKTFARIMYSLLQMYTSRAIENAEPKRWVALKSYQALFQAKDMASLPRTGLYDILPEEGRQLKIDAAKEGLNDEQIAVLAYWEENLYATLGITEGAGGTGKTHLLMRAILPFLCHIMVPMDEVVFEEDGSETEDPTPAKLVAVKSQPVNAKDQNARTETVPDLEDLTAKMVQAETTAQEPAKSELPAQEPATLESHAAEDSSTSELDVFGDATTEQIPLESDQAESDTVDLEDVVDNTANQSEDEPLITEPAELEELVDTDTNQDAKEPFTQEPADSSRQRDEGDRDAALNTQTPATNKPVELIECAARILLVAVQNETVDELFDRAQAVFPSYCTEIGYPTPITCRAHAFTSEAAIFRHAKEANNGTEAPYLFNDGEATILAEWKNIRSSAHLIRQSYVKEATYRYRGIRDSRVVKLQGSVAYFALEIAGLIPMRPEYQTQFDAETCAVWITKFQKLAEYEDRLDDQTLTKEDNVTRKALMTQLFDVTYAQIDVIVTTLSNAMDHGIASRFKADVIGLEEAGRVRECELWGLFSLYHTAKVRLFIGDSKQLPPILFAPTEYDGFFSQGSLALILRLRIAGLESPRLWRTERYSHPLFIKVLDAIYGENRIIASDTALMRQGYRAHFLDFVHTVLDAQHPIVLFDILGAKAQVNKAMSKYNRAGCIVSMHCITTLLRKGVPGREITYITPYKGQLQLAGLARVNAARRFPNIAPHLEQVQFSTIDSYMGKENSIAIVDAVVSGKIGFLGLVGRVTVMVSRARDGMAIVMNTENLNDSHTYHTALRKVITLLKNEGAVVPVTAEMWQKYPNYDDTFESLGFDRHSGFAQEELD